jgi:drug/metabolite transporter (DMT)-like permease
LRGNGPLRGAARWANLCPERYGDPRRRDYGIGAVRLSSPGQGRRRPLKQADVCTKKPLEDRLTTPAAVPAPGHGRAFWLGTLAAILTPTFFGSITTLSKLAYDSGTTAQSLVLARCVIFVIVIGMLIKATRRPTILSASGLRGSLWIAASTAIMSLGYLGSVAYIPVTLSAIIFFTFPLLVALLAALSGRERLSLAKAAALLVAFGGLVLALGPHFDSLDIRGILCSAVAGTAMAVTIAFSGPVLQRHDPLTMNVYINLWMMLAVAVVFYFAGGLAWPTTVGGYAAAFGVCALYVLAFTCWLLSLRLISPVRVASLFNLEPLITIAVAYVVLDERLSAAQSVGVVLVLGAIMSLALATRRPSN